jgi:hypothetical protein
VRRTDHKAPRYVVFSTHLLHCLSSAQISSPALSNRKLNTFHLQQLFLQAFFLNLWCENIKFSFSGYADCLLEELMLLYLNRIRIDMLQERCFSEVHKRTLLLSLAVLIASLPFPFHVFKPVCIWRKGICKTHKESTWSHIQFHVVGDVVKSGGGSSKIEL